MFGLLGSACGGPADAGLGLELRTGGLEGDPTRFTLSFYAPARTCADLRDPAARPEPLAGPFEVAAGPRGATLRLDEIPVGEYVVWVDAFDAQGGLLGSGCASGQRVYEGELSRIRVKIS